ncbi:MAG: NADH-quinone oxidoreductase subunit H [Acidobacteriota bacterium]|nr:NADH-quinone oxidoreductase subunit H [Acidobacteriota bacterium]
MSVFATSIAVIVAVVLGSYFVAVVERLLESPRHVAAALASPLREAASRLSQESLIPSAADRFLFRTAPVIAFASVCVAATVIPLSKRMMAFDPQIGLFFFLVTLGPFVVAMMNAGWSANSKAGLFGTFRAAAVLVAYEVPIGFAAIGPVMAAQSLSTTRIVAAQQHLWFVAWQPIGFLIYLMAALFMTYRHPFDLAQSGSELGGGVLAEYSGVRLLMFETALRAIFILLMAMGVVLFLGGGNPATFLLKTLLLAAAVLWMTRFSPRWRLDQMLSFAWKILLPAALVNLIAVGVIVLLQ